MHEGWMHMKRRWKRGITAALAAAKISVFCVSTFDTDYVLVKETALDAAVSALRSAGYAVG